MGNLFRHQALVVSFRSPHEGKHLRITRNHSEGIHGNSYELAKSTTSALRRKYLHITALRLIYLSSAFWRNYMAIREMGNNFRHDALVLGGVNIYT